MLLCTPYSAANCPTVFSSRSISLTALALNSAEYCFRDFFSIDSLTPYVPYLFCLISWVHYRSPSLLAKGVPSVGCGSDIPCSIRSRVGCTSCLIASLKVFELLASWTMQLLWTTHSPEPTVKV